MFGIRWIAAYLIRKRCGVFMLATLGLVFFTGLLLSFSLDQPHVQEIEQRLEEMRIRIRFMESLYRARQEDAFAFESRMMLPNANLSVWQDKRALRASAMAFLKNLPTCYNLLPPEINNAIKNISGSHTANGFNVNVSSVLRIPQFAYQLLPHLMADPRSICPTFNIKGQRNFMDVVVGVPTVRRDKESYLIITLTQLVDGLSEEDEPRTLIVVYVGETDPDYVLEVAKKIENLFSRQIESGLIEVLAPSPSFYPALESMEPTLGDPVNRFKWRTKQNLDIIYLMTYCQPRGTYYLMLEDDIVAKKGYMHEIKKFIAVQMLAQPNWIVLEFCRMGGIGKLFKSSDLVQFITYVQLFYRNMPIDWLIESFLSDKICTVEKSTKQCKKSKLEIRPRYETSLFQHIGLYSSLKGKIQKLKDTHYGRIELHHPHDNPPLASIRSDIAEYNEHSLRKAYMGVTYFWGLNPRMGDIMEFTFKTPIFIDSYLFRSGNVEHVSDLLYETSVSVLPSSAQRAQLADSYVTVGICDEFGYCEGKVDFKFGKIAAIRLVVHKDSKYWVIISEIQIIELHLLPTPER